ncbi:MULTISPECIES: antitoxin [Mumia]|uniref:antitoxin n=1 Tax=Mumia TaxID=1546255 RepID=UPI0014218F4F|nr:MULTISPECIES: antitoxin [unclassified Mumia]QMW64956.1 antitoxin [Mumia sp. ZJ1417]
MSKFDEAFEKFKDSSEDLAREMKERASTLVTENGDKIDDALVTVRDKAKELSKGKYDDKIDKAHAVAKEQIHKLDKDPGDGPGTGTTPPSPTGT